MRIERDESGDFILPSEELSGRFGLAVDDFRARQRRGLVKSTVEIGEGADAGTFRLTVRLGNRMWRAIIDAAGEVKEEGVAFVPGSSRSGEDQPA